MTEGVTIEVTPIEQAEAQSAGVAVREVALAVRVTDEQSKVSANELFLRCREARKRIAAVYDPHIERAKDAKKKADEARAALVKEKEKAESPIVEAEGIIKREILRYDAEEDARREQELREADMRSRKEAEEAALLRAMDAERAGDVAEADALIQEAVAPHIPVFSPRPPPPVKLSGTATYETWKFEIADLRALVVAVAGGRVPLAALCANEKSIGQAVRAMSRDGKSQFNWPGIRVWAEKGMKPTGRR